MKELFSIETAMKSGRAITLADPSNLVFKGPNGEYYDAAGQRIEYVPPVSPEEQKRREEEQKTAEHAEHIRNVCSGLESFTDAEIEWEIDDGFGHFGFKDLDGNVVIEPQYAWAGEFSHGLCPVNLNRTWYRSGSGSRYYENHFGYIDTNGKTVIPFRYDEATSFNKYGVAVVGDDTGTYLIDTTGKEIPGTRIGFWANIELDYDERYICFYDCDEVDPDTAEHPAGLYDTKARMILCELAYRDYYEYDEDTIEVTEDRVRPGETCAWLIDSIGALKYPWQAGMECASIDQPDENGNIIFARMTIEETEESQTCIRREGKCYKHRYWYGLVNRNGKILLQPEYESLWFIGKDLYGAVKDGKTIVFEAE